MPETGVPEIPIEALIEAERGRQAPSLGLQAGLGALAGGVAGIASLVEEKRRLRKEKEKLTREQEESILKRAAESGPTAALAEAEARRLAGQAIPRVRQPVTRARPEFVTEGVREQIPPGLQVVPTTTGPEEELTPFGRALEAFPEPTSIRARQIMAEAKARAAGKATDRLQQDVASKRNLVSSLTKLVADPVLLASPQESIRLHDRIEREQSELDAMEEELNRREGVTPPARGGAAKPSTTPETEEQRFERLKKKFGG